jgi:hypothetical protein
MDRSGREKMDFGRVVDSQCILRGEETLRMDGHHYRYFSIEKCTRNESLPASPWRHLAPGSW